MAAAIWRVCFHSLHALSVKESSTIDNRDQDKKKKKWANREQVWDHGRESWE
jgi:hypothetical protein